jgi:hypothetical protein
VKKNQINFFTPSPIDGGGKSYAEKAERLGGISFLTSINSIRWIFKKRAE